MKSRTLLRLVAFIFLLGMAATVLIVRPGLGELDRLLRLVSEMGPWGPLLFGVAYVVAVIGFVPGSVLTMAAGFVFGVAVGSVLVSFAATLGATGAFLLGRTLAREWIQSRVARSEKFQAIDKAVGRHGFKIVLLLRLSPIFPFNALNYVLGLTSVSLRDYVLASWIGMLPGTVMYVYLGSTVKSLTDLAAGKVEGPVAEKILFGVGLLAIVAVTIVVTRLARRALREAIPESNEVADMGDSKGSAHA